MSERTPPAEVGSNTLLGLTERLRQRHDFWSHDGGNRWYMSDKPDPDCAEAADEIERLRAALTRIARWHGEFPETGNFWDDEKTRPTSYGVEYGSNGERDYMRQVALDALGPNAPLTCPTGREDT
jgi:hypothetical protein